MKQTLLIPHIKIHNANAISSPYTIGFPAITGWLGAVHSMQRILNQSKFKNLVFSSTAIICHHIDLQTYKGKGDYVHSIVGTGNPLDKGGDRTAFIEEGRCHLDVSLVVEYHGANKDEEEELRKLIESTLHTKLKMAGGDILSFRELEFLKIQDEKDLYALIRKLMPGYALIERRTLIEEEMKSGKDAIDSILDYLKIMHRSEIDDGGNVTWNSDRKTSGWIVPIAIGYHGITELGQAENQRHSGFLHRFAESIITLGEFIMPYGIKDLDNMLWHYHVDFENNLYLCQQNKPIN